MLCLIEGIHVQFVLTPVNLTEISKLCESKSSMRESVVVFWEEKLYIEHGTIVSISMKSQVIR